MLEEFDKLTSKMRIFSALGNMYCQDSLKACENIRLNFRNINKFEFV